MALAALERWVAGHGGATAPVELRGSRRGTFAVRRLAPAELCRIPFSLILSEERVACPELRAAVEESRAGHFARRFGAPQRSLAQHLGWCCSPPRF